MGGLRLLKSSFGTVYLFTGSHLARIGIDPLAEKYGQSEIVNVIHRVDHIVSVKADHSITWQENNPVTRSRSLCEIQEVPLDESEVKAEESETEDDHEEITLDPNPEDSVLFLVACQETKGDLTKEEVDISQKKLDFDENSGLQKLTDEDTEYNETDPERTDQTRSIVSSRGTEDAERIQSNEQYPSAAWKGMLIRASICPIEDRTIKKEAQYNPCN